MKKITHFLLVFVLALIGSQMQSTAQELWGMTYQGGANNTGVVFKTDANGNNQIPAYSFLTENEGRSPETANLIQAANGKLYGVTYTGGASGNGVLFEYDQSTNSYTKKLDFESAAKGSKPLGSLTRAANGKLYGMTSKGGASDVGVLFEYDPSTNSYTKKLDFDGTVKGSSPEGSLVRAANGKLYGMTTEGGASGWGVLFEYDPDANSYTKKHDFDFGNGRFPIGSLIQASNGKLYGMTPGGGISDDGVLFEYDPSTNSYARKLDFEGTLKGSKPYGSLMQATNGKLYGMTQQGGVSGDGVLFEYDPGANSYTKKIEFEGTTKGSNPLGSLMQAANGKLYGLTRNGGASGAGVLFEYDPGTNSYTKKLDFDGTTKGSFPMGSLIQSANGKLYGLTQQGGASGNGVLFEYDPGTNSYTKKMDFTGPNGAQPYHTSLIEVGSYAAPVAVCQNTTLQLDASGKAKLLASSIDGGSTGTGIVLSASKTNFTCADVGKNTVTLIVTDSNGNTSNCTATVTVEDHIAPTVVTKNITVYLNANGIGSITADQVDNGSSDACGILSKSLNVNSFNCSKVGSVTVTLTVTDVHGNTAKATQRVTVMDNINPTIIAPANITADTNPGLCTKTFTLAQIGAATATDNCSVHISWKRSDNAPKLNSPFPHGVTTITWKATDGAGNIATSVQTINIEHAKTITTVTVSPDSQQYSDKVTFVANVTSCSGAGTIGGYVEFKVGKQVIGSALVLANGTATLKNKALLEPSPFGTAPIGKMSPGEKTVTATYSGDANHSNSFGKTNLTIIPEVADVTYNGGSYFTTNPSTYQGTIMLSAFLVDEADGSRGDIRNATATFRDGSVDGSALGSKNVPVGLVNPSVTTDGFATTNFNYTLSNSDLTSGGKTWEVWTTVGKYFSGQSDAYMLVTLGLPGPDYVTGGGYIVMNNSSGIYAGGAGMKMNFGLVMKRNKNGKSLQGKINVIYRREDGNYQIKSNDINSLVIESVDNTGNVVSGAAASFLRATISTKANFKKINADGTATGLGGNLNLIVTAWKSCSTITGDLDRISVQLAGKNGSGINFSSNWSSGNTLAQQLNGGKIQVQTLTTKSAEISTATEVLLTEPTLKAYPNPFTNKLNIMFSNETNTHARLEIYDVTGVRLETLFDSDIRSGELYNVEYLPKLVSSQMVFYHLSLGDKTYVGKAIYNGKR